MTKPRQFTLKDQAPAAIAYGSACRQQPTHHCLAEGTGAAGDEESPVHKRRCQDASPFTRADPRRLPRRNGLKCLKATELAKLYIRE